MPLPVATIGFTKTSAEHFFERLRAARVKRVVDVRLHMAEPKGENMEGRSVQS